ncbi:transcriptional regulator, AraC family [Neisseria sp. oral taxon 020 str. F0370]|nr:transcriptional regulator, AraC family [Neisseria sp. oral taxon 020 str. F0370]
MRWRKMDILDKLVALSQVSGSVDVQCLFQGEWYVRHEARRGQGLVHIVTGGEGWLKADADDKARRLRAGDVVFFPRTADHVLSSEADCANSGAAVVSERSGAFTLKRSGEGAADLSLFCARFAYDTQADLMAGLPETVLLDMRGTPLPHLVSLLQAEADRPQPGSKAVVDALSAVLLVSLVRVFLAEHPVRPLPEGLLKGWRDRRLRGVIQAVLDDPARAWTIEEMADAATVSRAQLMRLFKAHTGTSPYAFVNRIRLQQAAAMLKQSADSVLAVALACGFGSETHFGKAFKKAYGLTPGQYRKQADAAEDFVI